MWHFYCLYVYLFTKRNRNRRAASILRTHVKRNDFFQLTFMTKRPLHLRLDINKLNIWRWGVLVARFIFIEHLFSYHFYWDTLRKCMWRYFFPHLINTRNSRNSFWRFSRCISNDICKCNKVVEPNSQYYWLSYIFCWVPYRAYASFSNLIAKYESKSWSIGYGY